MRLSVSALVVAGLSLAQAHTILHNVYVNGKSQGESKCIRYNQTPEKRSFPVENLAGKEMACGFNGDQGVPRVCPVDAGSELTFEWILNPTGTDEKHLASGHKGPCSVMMKKVDSAIKDTGDGDGWFRIFYEGYNNSTNKWCDERMMADGFLTVKLPDGLAGGNYLVRPELLALHAANNNDPQFYISCYQIFLNSAGTEVPKDTVAIPGDSYAKAGSAAMTWNLYNGQNMGAYPNYGPATYQSATKVDPNAKPTVQQTEGLKPATCIMENANWCGLEVPEYTTNEGCWAAAKNCWDQGTDCFNHAPLNNDNCFAWQKQKCQVLNDACGAQKNNGPPDHLKDLTPPFPTINPPPAVNDQDTNQKTSAAGGSTSNNEGSSSSSSSAESPSSSSSSSSAAVLAVVGASGSASAAPFSSAADAYGSSPTGTATAESSQGAASASSTSAASSSTTEAPAPSVAVAAVSTCTDVITDMVTEVVTVTVQPK